jgi:hypothetical protein
LYLSSFGHLQNRFGSSTKISNAGLERQKIRIASIASAVYEANAERDGRNGSIFMAIYDK